MRLVIAGGGTGGHLFPALAIARAVRSLDPDGRILFVGTRSGIESRVIPETEFPIAFISAKGMRRTGLFNTVKAAFVLPRGIAQSIGVLIDFKPDLALGVGGYASGPTLAAAILMRIPTAIQEQNSVMGTTNRILSRFVDRIFVSWQDTEPEPSPAKTILAGNPVRRDILERTAAREADDQFHVLIFGGSQGARSINLAIGNNLDQLGPLAGRIAVMHQTGRELAEEMKSKYQAAGISADVREFINDMGSAYQWADLVVCRSGASSLAELTALGKPAIVVPYPYAIGDHQAKNAETLRASGAVSVIKEENLKNGAIISEIRRLFDDRTALAEMAENSRCAGRPDAANAIGRDLLALARPGTAEKSP
jgi:UDP-N-acetylglucosamine--N-acetylmuramyl-(pentapeptide) pyrophosphoryl-undecaprenol N-acetylglucosamine transferase